MSAARLAIADPPYPPFTGVGGRKNRASRWYGTGQRSTKDKPADLHVGADEWDDPQRHASLVEELCDTFDGWALATSADGLSVYPIPSACRVMVWVKTNAMPGAHRIRNSWEPVIVYPPVGRRSNRGGVGSTPDVLTCAAPRIGFIGAKPDQWTRWVLSAMTYQPGDAVVDMFPGSGAVARVLSEMTA